MTLVWDLFAESSSTIHFDDENVTSAVLADEGARLAMLFESNGLEPGDRIAIWMPNGRAYVRCLAAAAAGRFVIVSVNTRFSPAEAASIITRSGARLLVSNRDALGFDGVMMSPADIDGTLDEAPTEARPQPDDPYLVFTTSGTTSLPKLVLHHQRSLAVHARQVPARFGYNRNTRALVALPLCGVFGLNTLTGPLAAGADIWMPSRFDAAATAEMIATNRIDAMNGSDDMYHRLLATGHDLSSIQTAGCAAFNSSLDDIIERADTVGMRLTGIYGMSEVQAAYSFRDPSEPAEGRRRAGGTITSPDASARVVDGTTGEILPVGSDGELQLTGPSLFAGYLADGGHEIDNLLTDAAHVEAEGLRWFRTGDLARMEPDGSFTYLTRLGDVLRLGGFLVSPLEIETVVIEVEGITGAQVVAAARPDGVRPVAVVTADGEIDPQQVIDHCSGRLAKFKVPVDVLQVDDFPTTTSANGTKVQRTKLREMAERSR